MLKTVRVLRLRRRREERVRSLPSTRIMRVGLAMLAGIGMVVALFSLAAAVGYSYLTADLPPVQPLPSLLDPPDGLLLHPAHYWFSDKGHLLANTTPIVPVSLASLPEFVPKAVLTAVQPKANPALAYIGNFWQTNAAPTIAEQLAIKLLLRGERPSRRRRMRARLLASQMLSDYGGERVLEWYLNTADFGNGIVGIDEASRLYLGKPATQLTLSEAALLAAILPKPAINPWNAPTIAEQRRQRLLIRMLALAQITPSQAQKALEERPRVAKRPSSSAVVGLVRRQLADLGWGLPTRGLEVRTTLDYRIQRRAECLRTAVLKADLTRQDCPAARFLPPLLLTKPLPNNTDLEAVVLDVRSGAVLGLVSPTNLQKHAAGTFLSPWVYAIAFAHGGFSPATLTWDVPAALPAGIDAHNEDGRFHGPMRMRIALANNYLVPTLHLLSQLEADTVWPTAAHIGLPQLRGHIYGYNALLGKVSLNVLQAAHAFSAFAALGSWSGLFDKNSLQPLVVRQAVDTQKNLRFAPMPTSRQVLGQGVAYLVVNILADSMAKWQSLGHPNPLEIGLPVASLIGRAPDGGYWVIGATPKRVVLVYANAKTPKESKRGALAYWRGLARIAFSPTDGAWKKPPNISTVTVCDPSGMLPTPDCPNWVEEVFLSGYEPTAKDSLYRRVPIDKETGLRATAFTPPELVEERVYMHVPPEARGWAKQAGLPLPPTEYDLIAPPRENALVQIAAPRGFAYVRGKVQIRGTAAASQFAHYILQAGAGINPHAWFTIARGEKPVQNGQLGEWDTTGLKGLYTVQLLVAKRDGTLQGHTIQVTVDNEPPRVDFGAPRAGEQITFHPGGYLIVRAEADDNLSLASVSLWVDGEKKGTLTAAPYIFAVPMRRGKLHLRLSATDAAGNHSAAEIEVNLR